MRIQVRGSGILAFVVSLTVACGSSTPAVAPVAPAVATVAAQPAVPNELLVSVSLGSADTLANLRNLAEAVRPGAGAGLTDDAMRAAVAQLVGARSISGLDPKTWTIVVAKVGPTPSLALLGKVTDRNAITSDAGTARSMIEGDWAVVGPQPVLDKLGRYAVTRLAQQPTPAVLTATVWIPNVIASYPGELAQIGAQLRTSMDQPGMPAARLMMSAYLDGITSVGRELDAVVVTFEPGAALAALDIALRPRNNTRLAAFIAAQRPSSYPLLDRLPAPLASSAPMSLLAGHLEAGPYRDGFVEVMAGMLAPDASPGAIAAMKAYGQTLTGEVAGSFGIVPGGGMSFSQVYGVSDARAADQAISALFRTFSAGPAAGDRALGVRFQASAETSSHDGVTLRSYETSYDLSKTPEAQRKIIERMTPGGKQRTYLATFDQVGLLVSGPGGLAAAERAIDAVHGKASRFAAGALFAELLAASKARSDSLIGLFELGSLLPAGAPLPGGPMIMSVGFADHAAHLRMAMTPAAIRSLMQLAGPK